MSEVTVDRQIELEGRSADEVVKPRELHHINLRTTRLQEMIDFYSTLVGMKPNFQNEMFAAITFDQANHRIALMAFPFFKQARPAAERFMEAGYEHVAFEYDHLDELLHTYQRLQRTGISAWLTVNHGPTLSFYYQDPDQNNIELQVDCCDHDLERWKQVLAGPIYTTNQLGCFVDPQKMIQARLRGVDAQQILHTSYTEGDNPYSAPPHGPFAPGQPGLPIGPNT